MTFLDLAVFPPSGDCHSTLLADLLCVQTLNIGLGVW